jgi:hypothetical protein
LSQCQGNQGQRGSHQNRAPPEQSSSLLARRAEPAAREEIA